MQGYEKVSVRGLRDDDEALLFALAGEAYGDQLPAGETVAVLTRAQVFVAEAPDGEIAGYVALVDEGDRPLHPPAARGPVARRPAGRASSSASGPRATR